MDTLKFYSTTTKFDVESIACKCFYSNTAVWSELRRKAIRILEIFSDSVVLPIYGRGPRTSKIWIFGVKDDDPVVKFLNESIQDLSTLNVVSHYEEEKGIVFDPGLFQNALEFSIPIRLSPLWNRIGSHYVKGRNFLHECDNKIPFVDPEIRFRDFQIEILLRSTGRFCLPKFRLEEIDIRPNPLKLFREGKVNVIDCRYIGCVEVYVLPNLTPARIISISRDPLSPLDNWESMKRYWKNMYGYRLSRNCSSPDDDKPEFYVNVIFEFSSQPLCYPKMCVIPSSPNFVSRKDPSIDQIFIDQLQSRLRYIAQQKVNFTLINSIPIEFKVKQYIQDKEDPSSSSITNNNYLPKPSEIVFPEKSLSTKFIFTKQKRNKIEVDKNEKTVFNNEVEQEQISSKRKKKNNSRSSGELLLTSKKTTISDLVSWLKDNKIPYKSKDRKEVLLTKVSEALKGANEP